MRVTIILFLLIILILELCRIDLINNIDPPNPEYENIISKTDQLHQNNLQLEDHLLHLESFTRIYQDASKEGFVPALAIYLR